ncbi:type IIL restriction-modification enzyme MmeI [Dermabacteraceae bacterium P13147]
MDYVACWYAAAANYLSPPDGETSGGKARRARKQPARCAFVSTNSICQGQQVAPLWRPLFARGFSIDFAHRPFVWGNESNRQAHVHVVIVGFSQGETPGPKRIYSYDSRGRALGATVAGNINGYLADAPDVFVERRSKPLCDVSPVVRGCQPTDKGNLLLDEGEKEQLLREAPEAAQWLRPFSMGQEFISGKPRYCLWLVDCPPAQIARMEPIRERVKAVREYRLSSTKAATRKKAETPWLFDEVRDPGKTYIGVPSVSSERRTYIPAGFVTDGMIPGNMLYFIPTGSLYVFGVFMSRFHNAWMRTVAGRLEMRYRYSNMIVYNNFVWPEPSDRQRARIEECAREVVAARSHYMWPDGEPTSEQAAGVGAPRPQASLADLYDPDNDFLYPRLAAAHRALDKAVEEAYGVDFDGDEQKIVAHLFRLYAEATA